MYKLPYMYTLYTCSRWLVLVFSLIFLILFYDLKFKKSNTICSGHFFELSTLTCVPFLLSLPSVGLFALFFFCSPWFRIGLSSQFSEFVYSQFILFSPKTDFSHFIWIPLSLLSLLDWLSSEINYSQRLGFKLFQFFNFQFLTFASFRPFLDFNCCLDDFVLSPPPPPSRLILPFDGNFAFNQVFVLFNSCIRLNLQSCVFVHLMLATTVLSFLLLPCLCTDCAHL